MIALILSGNCSTLQFIILHQHTSTAIVNPDTSISLIRTGPEIIPTPSPIFIKFFSSIRKIYFGKQTLAKVRGNLPTSLTESYRVLQLSQTTAASLIHPSSTLLETSDSFSLQLSLIEHPLQKRGLARPSPFAAQVNPPRPPLDHMQQSSFPPLKAYSDSANFTIDSGLKAYFDTANPTINLGQPLTLACNILLVNPPQPVSSTDSNPPHNLNLPCNYINSEPHSHQSNIIPVHLPRAKNPTMNEKPKQVTPKVAVVSKPIRSIKGNLPLTRRSPRLQQK